MSLLNRLKSVLGLDGTGESVGDEPAAVTVEREPTGAGETGTDRSEETTAVDAPEASFESDESSTDDVGPVTEISGVGDAYAERLGAAGVETIGELADADPSALAAKSGISEKRVSTWVEAAGSRAANE